MSGVNENQLSYRSQLLRRCLQLGPVPIADPDFYTDSPLALSAYAVGDFLALDRTRAPNFGANITAVIVDANASITELTVRFRGKNQFGEAVTEDLSWTAVATKTGTKVFCTDITAEVISIGGTVTATVDTIDVGFGNVHGLPVKLQRLGNIVNIYRNTNTPALADIDTDTVDVDESALKGNGANGAGSNSGTFAASDSFAITYVFDPNVDGPDRLEL